MTTRRKALRLAGALAAGVAGAGALGASAGCQFRSGDRTTRRAPTPGDALIVELAGGALAVVDAATGRLLVNPGPAVLSGDGRRLVRAEQPDGGTRLTSHRLPDGAAVAGGTLTGTLAVRATSADGALVALANDAGPGHTPYRPGPRERTTIVVADGAGQRRRLELPGNLEPEAFDATGSALFVLDYLPPTAPDRYRVRVVDLASGQVQPLLTRVKAVVPGGAEEEMRGEGRQAVYDSRRKRLFTLYTHQPDHVHTRDRIAAVTDPNGAGAREDAPHVHAFVHTLDLNERWAFCVDLPAPFGERAAIGHTIALSRDGSRLHVADTGSGTLAMIDPEGLTVLDSVRFDALADTGDSGSAAPAAATFDGAGMLLVGAGREVVGMAVTAGGGTDPRWSTPAEVRGLAGPPDGTRLYVGQPDAVLRVDAGTGAVRQRIDVPGLVALRHVIAPA
ncbi:YncE family protein [Plantactinospora solaniradicis]|uniref:YncE family protein n=1 Tax=Plantactinospora solaniradicis TaxID=1723736 RepID=A0ABW1KCI9_9ACTN